MLASNTPKDNQNQAMRIQLFFQLQQLEKNENKYYTESDFQVKKTWVRCALPCNSPMHIFTFVANFMIVFKLTLVMKTWNMLWTYRTEACYENFF